MNLTITNMEMDMSREDWRRSNVDSIIVMLSKAIKEENKLLQIRYQPLWCLAK